VDIPVEKTWDRSAEPTAALPRFITVRLYGNGAPVDIATITAATGWTHTFTAPKYDAAGDAIGYTVAEDPIPGWRAAVHGFQILNTYINSTVFDIPAVRKAITGDTPVYAQTFRFQLAALDGAPMPDGASNGRKTITISGEGQAAFGGILYTRPGEYRYTVRELNSGLSSYTFDSTEYTLTVTVAEGNNALQVQSAVWTADGGTRGEALFTNHYERPNYSILDDHVVVSGGKTWEHGENLPATQPKDIIVRVLGNGKQMVERRVNANDGWRWSFILNRFDAKGKEIVYTVDERDVPGYAKRIDGYDIVNTWIAPEVPPIDEPVSQPGEPATEPGETVTEPGETEQPGEREPGETGQTGDGEAGKTEPPEILPEMPNPKTGDTLTPLWLLLLPIAMSAAGLALLRKRRKDS